MNISLEMAKLAIKALDDKKGEDIRIIDISTVSSVADFFIIAHATNSSQMHALVDNVEDSLAKEKYFPKHIEGRGSESWILLDYRDIIVHIFSEEDREFYDLERIWKDGTELSVDTFL